MGQAPPGESYNSEGEGHVLVQGNADLQNGVVCPRVWTTAGSKFAPASSVIFSVRAPVGEVGVTTIPVALGRGVAGLETSRFVYHALVRLGERRYWDCYSTGSTFAGINGAELGRCTFSAPEDHEAAMVSGTLDQISRLIALHQRASSCMETPSLLTPNESMSTTDNTYRLVTDR